MFGEDYSESPRLPSPWEAHLDSPGPGGVDGSGGPLIDSKTPPSSLSFGTSRTLALVPEADLSGHIEYKLRLPPRPSADRLARLTSQLKWRLLEGGGEAIYEIGVCDNGFLLGIGEQELEGSIGTLGAMARSLGASMEVVRRLQVTGDGGVVQAELFPVSEVEADAGTATATDGPLAPAERQREGRGQGHGPDEPYKDVREAKAASVQKTPQPPAQPKKLTKAERKALERERDIEAHYRRRGAPVAEPRHGKETSGAGSPVQTGRNAMQGREGGYKGTEQDEEDGFLMFDDDDEDVGNAARSDSAHYSSPRSPCIPAQDEQEASEPGHQDDEQDSDSPSSSVSSYAESAALLPLLSHSYPSTTGSVGSSSSLATPSSNPSHILDSFSCLGSTSDSDPAQKPRCMSRTSSQAGSLPPPVGSRDPAAGSMVLPDKPSVSHPTPDHGNGNGSGSGTTDPDETARLELRRRLRKQWKKNHAARKRAHLERASNAYGSSSHQTGRAGESVFAAPGDRYLDALAVLFDGDGSMGRDGEADGVDEVDERALASSSPLSSSSSPWKRKEGHAHDRPARLGTGSWQNPPAVQLDTLTQTHSPMPMQTDTTTTTTPPGDRLPLLPKVSPALIRRFATPSPSTGDNESSSAHGDARRYVAECRVTYSLPRLRLHNVNDGEDDGEEGTLRQYIDFEGSFEGLELL